MDSEMEILRVEMLTTLALSPVTRRIAVIKAFLSELTRKV